MLKILDEKLHPALLPDPKRPNAPRIEFDPYYDEMKAEVTFPFYPYMPRDWRQVRAAWVRVHDALKVMSDYDALPERNK